jgi:energy-coupling factor transport system ATP-binding protein
VIPAARANDIHEKVVSIRNLRYSYEGRIQALVEVNIDIRAGEFVAIVGGNGSGKTTLAKAMIGLLKPATGSVTVAGKRTSASTVAELARVIGYAYQNPDHQLFCATVQEEVAFGPTNLGFAPADVARKVEHAIESMNLEAIRKEQPLSLSLGDRRKVSLASVIAMDPRILVLDEPTTGLDADDIEDLMSSIDALNAEGRTIMLITHDMRLVADYARRVVVMGSGRILLDCDPKGAFYDLQVLKSSSLEPPTVAILAHRLSALGVRKDVLTPDELVMQLFRGGDFL